MWRQVIIDENRFIQNKHMIFNIDQEMEKKENKIGG